MTCFYQHIKKVFSATNVQVIKLTQDIAAMESVKTLTCQAISEEDRKSWMSAMGGKQPEPLQSRDNNKQVR